MPEVLNNFPCYLERNDICFFVGRPTISSPLSAELRRPAWPGRTRVAVGWLATAVCVCVCVCVCECVSSCNRLRSVTQQYCCVTERNTTNLDANGEFSPATAQVEFRHQSAESAATRPWRPFPSRSSTAKSTQGGHRVLAASGRHARQEAAEARARGGRKSLSAGSSTPPRHKRRGDTGRCPRTAQPHDFY
jgi:hypothetical protein